MEAALAFALGIAIGIVFSCLCKSGKIASLQSDLETKKDAWCAGCTLNKRLKHKMDYIEDREAYIRTLEDRCANQRKSISALGANLQKRTLGVA
jgi:hypothetical protein